MSRFKVKRIFLLLLIISAVSMLLAPTAYAIHCEPEEAVTCEKINTGVPDTPDNQKQSVRISSRIYELLFDKSKTKTNELYLIPGGEAFGLKLTEPYVTVSGVKNSSPFKKGDIIISINGIEINCIDDVGKAVDACGGSTISAEILRSGEKMTVTITPKYEDGSYRLGVTLRQVASGIGTITFIEPTTGAFGGLGHGVCESESGKPIEINSGEVRGVVLGATTRGEIGKPGELSGVLNKSRLGTIYKNSECGVFGVLENSSSLQKSAIPVASKSEITTGEAEIISTVKNGKTARYKIEISDIDINSTGSKSFKIKVTDPMLIALTGGIVRGMSGSPIIQDGKLVGAVTHVMVADPTEGYGIFIENMLAAAESQATPKAA